MAITAWVFGILGGLCAVMGIITAAEVEEVIQFLGTGFTSMFWLALGAVLLLACIAFATNKGEGYE